MSELELSPSSTLHGSASTRTTCVVCEVATAKYKCPTHKQELQCSGKRSRHEYVPVSEYNETTMISDYRMLEEGADLQSSLQKACSRVVTGQTGTGTHRSGAAELVKAAARYRIDLKFMSAGMQRHTTNTTVFSKQDRCICWRLELRFPLASQTVHLDRILDSTTLEQVLISAFSWRHGNAAQSVQLSQYTAATPAGCSVVLQREQVPHSCARLKNVGIKQTVQDALAGECVIEFPIFIVQLKQPDS
eukprot:jgi/Ulvmu1/4144/UM019_0123.1